MNVRVLLFAVAREIAGTTVVELDAPQPATVADIKDLLAKQCPELGDIEAGQWLIDRIKEAVPIWKQERYADGATEWVHPEEGRPPGAV